MEEGRKRGSQREREHSPAHPSIDALKPTLGSVQCSPPVLNIKLPIPLKLREELQLFLQGFHGFYYTCSTQLFTQVPSPNRSP
eukprot:1551156-Rhodomonas_salina.1